MTAEHHSTNRPIQPAQSYLLGLAATVQHTTMHLRSTQESGEEITAADVLDSLLMCSGVLAEVISILSHHDLHDPDALDRAVEAHRRALAHADD